MFRLSAPVRKSVVAFAVAVGFSVNAAEPTGTTQPAPTIKRTILDRADVPGSNYEVVVVLVEAPARTSAGKHVHAGRVVGYVMEGEYTMLLEGQPPRALRAGDSLEVPPGVVHDERSGDLPARLLAVFTVEKGKPLTTPVTN